MEAVRDKAKRDKYIEKMRWTEYFSFDIRPFLSVVKFDSGERLLREGEKPEALYYLLEGRAKLFLSHENGRVSLINFLEAPCFIGEMELIGAMEAARGVTAILPCICCVIQVRDCRDKLLSDTRFLQRLCLFLGQKAISNTDNYSRNQSYPLQARLADFILMTAQNGIYRERHTEVSEFLGVTYRHLLYVLADFVKQGLLQKTKQGYRIADKGRLQELAAGFCRSSRVLCQKQPHAVSETVLLSEKNSGIINGRDRLTL
ncbi:MAG: transcriptional regulator YeiL [Lachnospiraceae bacterium]|nr:transcriptional regulator YeiL [Lachnospiraceae bacterium]